TGHLVFSTLHTLDTTETINRIIAVFPPHQQKQVRLQLASVLKAVISQRLMPKADGNGRAPAVEVMISTPLDRKSTRLNSSHQIPYPPPFRSRPAIWVSRPCTRSPPPRPSIASSPSSRRTSRSRCACSSPACSKR